MEKTTNDPKWATPVGGGPHVDIGKYRRSSIKGNAHKVAFLQAVVTLGQHVQRMTWHKARNTHPPKKTKTGIKACLVSAICIYRSDWGLHPVAQPRYFPDNNPEWIHGNNLCLLEVVNDHWYGMTIEYGGVTYKGFPNWAEFANHLSEVYSWSPYFEHVLDRPFWLEQLELLAFYQEMPDEFYGNVFEIVRQFGLEEFDLG